MRRRQLAAACAIPLARVGGGPGRAEEPGIEAIDHVGLSTVDIERSIHLDRDLFGMELVQRLDVSDQAEFDHIFALEHVKAKGAILRLGSMRIELFEFLSPRGRAPDLRQAVNNPRIYHICFAVKDIDKEYARLKAAGLDFHLMRPRISVSPRPPTAAIPTATYSSFCNGGRCSALNEHTAGCVITHQGGGELNTRSGRTSGR